MTRWSPWILAVALAVGAGCNKPAEGDCRKAIRNMQRLLGTDKLHSAQNVEAAVRSCRGASKKASVECAIQAQTLDQLKQCSFYHEQGLKDDGSGSAGSAAPTGSGSAAPAGSNPGSAAPAGSNPGSAAPAGSDPGSGSAAAGSSSAGSGSAAPAAGSGSGSAAPAGSGT